MSDHGATALQVQGWRSAPGEPGAPEHHCGQSPASARPERRASDRSSSSGSGGGGGGGAAPSPPPEGSTDNKSWVEKRRQRGRIVYPTRLLPGPAAKPLKGRGTPVARDTASTSWVPALPQLRVAAGVLGGRPQVALAQRLGGRGSEPRVGRERGPPRCRGLAHRCQDWQTRRCSWLAPFPPSPCRFRCQCSFLSLPSLQTHFFSL